MRRVFIWQRMDVPPMIDALRWLASTPSPRLNWSTGPNQRGYPQKTTGLQTFCPGLVQLNVASFGRVLRQASGPVQSSAIYHLKCLTFNVLTGFFRDLARKMKYVQSKTWAPNTFKAISSQWRAFKIFSGLAGITHLPIPANVIFFFAMWLLSTGRVKSRGSLAQYVSAIRTVHKILRLEEVPMPSQYGPLDMIPKGTRRICQHRVKKSHPVTPPILRNLLNSTIPPLSGPIDHTLIEVYKSLSLIYYLSMLRSSNLIKTTAKIDLEMILCWDNIKPLHNDINKGILLTITKSKKNQFRE